MITAALDYRSGMAERITRWLESSCNVCSLWTRSRGRYVGIEGPRAVDVDWLAGDDAVTLGQDDE